MPTLHILKYKTRGNTSPQGKRRVYFCVHEKDLSAYFDEITGDILKYQDCAIWYDSGDGEEVDEKTRELDLSQMNLFVMPVTTRLLTDDESRAMKEFHYAIDNHIPVLPLMQEQELEEIFNKKCGDLQFLDKNKRDDTAISYDEKLEKYLSSVLIGNELAKKVRAAFDAYIFLSYRKKDREYAQKLMRLIHENEFCRDIAIWYDEFLTPGENFNEEIAEALDKSKLFALAVTPNLVNEKNYVMTVEYPMARKAEKKILPAEVVPTDKEALKASYDAIPDSVDAYDPLALSEALMRELEELAVKENDSSPEHNFFIGLAYLSGIDVEVDHTRAVKLITSAANAELPEAIEKLVSMYRNGEGVLRDYGISVAWQRKLIEIRKREYEENESEDTAVKYIFALTDQIEYLCELDWFEEAESLAQEELNETERLKDIYPNRFSRHIAYSYIKLGDICRLSHKNKNANEYYKKALESFEHYYGENPTLRYRSLIGDCHLRIGLNCEVLGAFDVAEKYYRKAYDIFDEMNRNDRLFHLNGMLGEIFEKRGDLEEAKQYYLKSFGMYEYMAETEKSDLTFFNNFSVMCRKLGGVYFKLNDLENAEKYIRNAYETDEIWVREAPVPKSYRSLSNSYLDFADICNAKGDLSNAAEYSFKALRVRENYANGLATTESRQKFISWCEKQAVRLMSKKAFRCAEIFYQELYTYFEEKFNGTGAYEDRRSLANAYEKLGDVKKAQDLSKSAQEHYKAAIVQRMFITAKVLSAENYYELSNAFYKMSTVTEGRKKKKWLKKTYKYMKVIVSKFPDEKYAKLFETAKNELGKK